MPSPPTAAAIAAALAAGRITVREQRILLLRYGLVDGRARSLAEIGRAFGVTGEEIRRRAARALTKVEGGGSGA